MVRFIIINFNTFPIPLIIFTFQYGQIYYDKKRMPTMLGVTEFTFQYGQIYYYRYGKIWYGE